MDNNWLIIIIFHLLKINPLQGLCLYLFSLAGYLAVSGLDFNYSEAGLLFLLIMGGQGVYSYTKTLFPTNSLFAPADKTKHGQLNRLIVLVLLIVFSFLFIYTGLAILEVPIFYYLPGLVIILAISMLGDIGIYQPYLKGGLAGVAPAAGFLAGGGILSAPVYLLWLTGGFWWSGLVIISLQFKNKNLIYNPSFSQKEFWDRMEKVLVIFNFTVALLGWLAFGRLIDADFLYFSVIIICFAGSIFALKTPDNQEKKTGLPARRAAAIMSAGFFLAVLLDFLVVI